MSEVRKGKKPTPEQEALAEANKSKPEQVPEVQAQTASYPCSCWACGCTNFVQDWWTYFICRRCGTLNTL